MNNALWRQLAIATNWPILLAVGVLSTMGVVCIGAHAGVDPRNASDVYRQLTYIAIGVICMAAMQTVSYTQVGRYAWPIYIASILVLVYTISPVSKFSGFLGVPDIKGARRWINFGVMSLQPTELAKVAVCLVVARYLRFRSNYRTFAGLLPPFALVLVPVVLILKQPDMGTAMVFIPTLFAMLFIAGAKIKHLLLVMLMGVAFVPIAWFSGPKGENGLNYDLPILRHMPTLLREYQRARVNAMFSKDPNVLNKTGFQQERALTAFAAGGVTGRGLGQIPVGRTVPEVHNDMIFAIIGEQFGLLGTCLILGAYLILFTAGIEVAAGTKEPFGRLVAVGTVSLLAGQMIINLMVPMRLMPVTGITLPFVSFGGSSILASYIAAGLLLNIGQNRPLVIAREAFEY